MQPDPHAEPAAAEGDDRTALTVRATEIGVALFTTALGAVVMVDSYAHGIGWDDRGPGAGYIPFYIGLLMVLASLGSIAFTRKHWHSLGGALVTRGPLRRVFTVFVPMCIYAIGIRLLGMYIASALFIAWFMWRERGEGRHSPLRIAAVSLGTTLACYLIFELWFKVPMYAGPVFQYFGLGG